MSDDAIEQRLRVLIDDALEQAGHPPLDPATGVDVFLPDVLESVVLAALITSIESEWDIEIDESSIEIDNFADLGSIARLVEQMREAGSTT